MSPSRYLPTKDKEFSVGAENVSPLLLLLPFQGVMFFDSLTCRVAAG
jgi:hypothetical protein